MSVTRHLADLGADVSWSALGRDVRQATVRTTVNAVALMVGAAGTPTVDRALDAVRRLGPPPSCGVLGRPERASAVWAALVNGLAGHAEDYDDTHFASIVHPGPPVVAAALAVHETTGGNGTDLLESVAVGAEAAIRVGLGTGRAVRRGWHVTGIAAPVGAALAACHALRLDRERTTHALGLAAGQGAGYSEALGTMAKPFHAGRAAATGVEAALLARGGVTAPADAVEGTDGLWDLVGDRSGERDPLRGLGTEWELTRNVLKPYSCGVLGHSVVDAARRLRRETSSEPLTAVRLRVSPIAVQAMGRSRVRDGLEARFSLRHCFAVGYLLDQAGPAEFTDEVAGRPDVSGLRDRVEVTADDTLSRFEVHVEVDDTSGGLLRQHLEGPDELTDEGLDAKVRDLVGPVLGDRAGGLVRTLGTLESLTSVVDLVDAARP